MYFAIPNLTTQRRPTVLRYPHQVQMNLEYRMRAASAMSQANRGARAEAVA
jgi:hypothetical protein